MLRRAVRLRFASDQKSVGGRWEAGPVVFECCENIIASSLFVSASWGQYIAWHERGEVYPYPVSWTHICAMPLA